MRAAIVCFEIEIERLEGNFKLNQNRTAEDRDSAIAGLAASDDEAAREAAELMIRRSAQKPK